MGRPAKVVLKKNGYRTTWYYDPDDRTQINVDVIEIATGENVLEWAYGKLFGKNLNGNASFYLDQVIMQVQTEKEKSNA